MKILVAGATGCIGIHVVNTAIAMGHQPVDLVSTLSNDAAKNKTFELVAERGEAQQDLPPLFANLQSDNPQKNDGVFDIDNMPLHEEPECIINDLNLHTKVN
ncbi:MULTISPECIES: hypothetical protein [unclassified Escherichia]|uniref:hypothetical protein n=1 Tax=unclassified Escherichia TaxID=2608889 RepID=UPI001029D2F3|nr:MULTISPECIES: hypothetical protein [unclassified Escherichia]RZN45502.1 hypothetical protein D9597_19970 [Escherichia sp. E13S3]TGB71871.1 hypothetical protein CRI67_22380 [Escherichia sp. E4702]TGC04628.1 hypothetical protein CRI63_05455 [Escherichia sp. E2661]